MTYSLQFVNILEADYFMERNALNGLHMVPVSYTITWRTLEQKVLFNCELRVQKADFAFQGANLYCFPQGTIMKKMSTHLHFFKYIIFIYRKHSRTILTFREV